MSTPEEILRDRADTQLTTSADAAAVATAAAATELGLAQERLAAAIEAASTRLEAAGCPDGSLRHHWKGGERTVDVAVWILHVDLPGFYYLAPSSRAVLTVPLSTQVSRERHRRNITLQQQDFPYYHALEEGWLLGLSLAMSASELDAITTALEELAPAS